MWVRRLCPSNGGACAPAHGPKGRAGGGCGSGSSPPAAGVRGYHPRKIFDFLDAKSCVLMHFWYENRPIQGCKIYVCSHTCVSKNPCDDVFDDNLNTKYPIVIFFWYGYYSGHRKVVSLSHFTYFVQLPYLVQLLSSKTANLAQST